MVPQSDSRDSIQWCQSDKLLQTKENQRTHHQNGATHPVGPEVNCGHGDLWSDIEQRKRQKSTDCTRRR